MMTAKGRFVAALLLALVAFGCADRAASAQTGRNPFAIAGGEAAGAATGLAGTILAWQNKFHFELQTAAKAFKTSAPPSGRWRGRASPTACFTPRVPATARPCWPPI